MRTSEVEVTLEWFNGGFLNAVQQ